MAQRAERTDLIMEVHGYCTAPATPKGILIFVVNHCKVEGEGRSGDNYSVALCSLFGRGTIEYKQLI